MSAIDLSIVMPCYNEVTLLAHSVDELVAVMRATCLRYELIFVDDASKDATVQLLEEQQRRYPDVEMMILAHVQNQGRGRAASDGFRAAHGRIIGYLDIDLEVHARYLPAMVDAIDRQGYEVATAWRVYQATRSGMFRALCSKGYHSLARWALDLPYEDTETGFKFFRCDALARVLDRPQHPGWFWDTEIMTYCAREGMRVAEIPCTFMRRSDKVSSVRVVRDSIDYLRSLWQFRRRLSKEYQGVIAGGRGRQERRSTNVADRGVNAPDR